MIINNFYLKIGITEKNGVRIQDKTCRIICDRQLILKDQIKGSSLAFVTEFQFVSNNIRTVFPEGIQTNQITAFGQIQNRLLNP